MATVLAWAWVTGLLLALGCLVPPLRRRTAHPHRLIFLILLAALAFAEVGAVLEPQHRGPAPRMLLAIALALTAGLAVRWLAERVRLLESATVWSHLHVAGLLAVLAGVVAGAPPGHRGGIGGLLGAAFLLIVASAVHASLLRRRWAAGFYLGAGLLILIPVAGYELRRGGPPHASRPHLVLISVDTLRADHLGCYERGNAETPEIDRLAAEGVLFEQAMTPIPLTNPAHTSLLTGLYPGHHGVVLNRPLPLASRDSSLPLLLHGAGYRTAGFVGGAPLHKSATRLAELFEVWDDHFGPLSTVGNLARQYALPGLGAAVEGSLRGVVVDRQPYDRPAQRVVDAASAWLRRNGDRPFFLFVHLFDPHGPYWPPEPYRRLAGGEAAEAVSGDWYRLEPPQREAMLAEPRELEAFGALYRGEVEYMDQQVGKLLGALADEGLLEDTLVIFTADHGESLTEHDYYFDHSVTLFEESLHVPLIVRPPAASAWRGRRQGLVSLIDIAPTVLELLGIRGPAVDGTSLLSSLEGDEGPADRRLLAALFPPEIEGHKALISVREERFKYIRTLPWWNDLLRMPGGEELYDLTADPGETRDLVHERSEVAEELRQVAARYVVAWLVDLGPAPELPAGLEERLRALGYL